MSCINVGSAVQHSFKVDTDLVNCPRQQDQALQSQRHTALQRLNYLQHNAAAQQQVVLGRADARLPVPVCRCASPFAPNFMQLSTKQGGLGVSDLC